MASGMSDYLRNALLDHSLGKTSFTMPAAAYLALGTTTWSASGAGTELAGSGYARVAIAGASLSAASSGASTTTADLVTGTLSGTFTNVQYWAIYDASTSGNVLWWGAFASPKTANSGDQFRVAAGELDFSIVNT